MPLNKNLDLVKESLRNLALKKNEREEIDIFISKNIDQFLEISQRTVSEIKKIKDKYPKNWKEMVAMTMFSTL